MTEKPAQPISTRKRILRLSLGMMLGLSTVVGDGSLARAADDGAVRPTIIDPDEVWTMSTEARGQSHPLRVEGRINFADTVWGNMWIECPQGLRYIPMSRESPPPLRSGQRVVIEGRFVPVRGLESALVRVQVLEEAAPVQAMDAEGRIGEITLFDRRIVTTTAYVDDQQVIDAEHLRLYLIIDDHPVICWVPPEDEVVVPDFRRKFVRIRALYSGRMDPTGTAAMVELWATQEKDVVVTGAIETSPGFDVPLTPVGAISGIAPGTVARIRGHLQRRDAGEAIVVRDQTGEILLRSLQRERLPLGTEIEAVGRLVVVGSRWIMESALFRRVASAPAGDGANLTSGGDHEVLRRIEDVRRLNREQASQGRAVDITGAAVWSMPGEKYFYLHDLSGGIRVHRVDGMMEPPLQKSLRVIGRTRAGGVGAEVEADSIHDLGTMAHPQARMITVEQAMSGSEDGQWVGMRGFLRAVVSEGEWRWIHVTSPDGEFVGHLQSPVTFVATQGSLIRMQGVCESALEEDGRIGAVLLRIPFLHDITVEEDAPADLFDLPIQPLDGLRQTMMLRDMTRARVAGIALHHEPGQSLVIQQGDTAVRVLTRSKEVLAPGDRVEAVGIVGRSGAHVVVRDAVIRKMGSGDAPAPLEISAATPLRESLDERLVRLRGTLADVVQQPGRLQLTLNDGETYFEAILTPDAGIPPPVDLVPGAVVDVTGLFQIEYNDARQPQGFRLRLRTMADLAVAVPARYWSVQRLFAVLEVLAGCVVLSGIAIILLRRRVRRQTTEITRQLERQAGLEAELERAQRFKALGLLAGGIAHDFNNLLTSMMGNASVALFDKEVAKRAGDCLRDIEDSAARAHQLTQQLVTFAKGGDPLLEPLEFSGMVNGIARRVLSGAKVRAEIVMPADLWPISADPGQMTRAIENLLLRGRGDPGAHGGVVTIVANNTTISSRGAVPVEPGRYVEVCLRGCGGPVPEEKIRIFFDPYATTTSDSDRFSMAIVYSIVKRHGGHVVVESSAGEGTVFRLWIPAADSLPAVSAATGQPEAGTDGVLHGARVLLMDDEETIRRLGERCLRLLGCEPQVAADGGECVRVYEAALQSGRRFDAVILDLTVPGGLGGRETIEALLKMDPSVRAIVSSGYSNDPVMARYREHGFAAVVPKPYAIATLTETLQRVLAR